MRRGGDSGNWRTWRVSLSATDGSGSDKVNTGSESSAARRVLEVRDIRTRFHTQDGVVHAVNGISFDLDEGELPRGGG